MFRRKGRLTLTQLVLITAGTMFLMVMSLSSSISLTLEKIYERRRYDVTMTVSQNQRIDRLIETAQSVEGVEKAEVHFTHSATLLVKGQQVKEAGIGTTIEGVPAGSDFFKPFMVAGRWLQPGDDRAVVLTKGAAAKSGVTVGDTVTLNLAELDKHEWQVVGLYDPVFAGTFGTDIIYAPQEALFNATKHYNRGGDLYVRTRAHDAASVDAVVARVKELLETQNVNVFFAITEYENKRTNDFQFGIVLSMMLSLAVIVAVVGGIALMGALSISVVERTKEIGVLRAVGARSRTILGMFVMEGTLQGLLSWAIAVPISFFSSRPLADALGQTMFSANLDYQYNYTAVATWLALILVISALASILPARSATHISVRESLAYA